MTAGRPLCQILRRDGLPRCADFIAKRIHEIDPQRFVDHFCGPRRFVHVPLSCIFWDLNIPQDSASGFEVEHLLKVIDGFKEYHKISEPVVGAILDHCFECHLNRRIFFSISDLICLFSLLQSTNPQKILNNLKNDHCMFYLASFNEWISTFNVDFLPKAVVWLWKGTDVSTLFQVFSYSKTADIQEFIAEIDVIQQSLMALSSEDWQRIINRRTGNGPEAISVLLSAALGRCFMNWLADIEGVEHGTDLPLEIMTVLMALVQERNWRYADVSKLFRFSNKPEDLPGLLTALTQIHEANLKSTALNKLSSTIPAEAIGDMLESDREFEPKMEIPRDEAIRQIVNSDFNTDIHKSAEITESQLQDMMTSFDESYNDGGGEFANVAKAVKAVEHFVKIKMRDVQILAVLLAKAARSACVARLLQMQTGEGKTYVIAAIAISEVFDGNRVDIITSSESLAVTQCAELRELYASVGVSVQENCSMDRAEKEKTKIYDADVVYGSATHFMFDALHQDFYESKIRGNRGYPLAIVDEVDSQMLDHANYVCRLASDTSGMGNLLGIQATVWMFINHNFNKMKQNHTGWKVSADDGEVLIEDVKTLKKYFRKGLLEVFQKMAGFIPGSEEDTVGVPETLWDYAKKELPMWIDSAVDALMKTKDFDYCVDEGEVVIVDSATSGARNKGMRWSHGLHEFLEILNATNLKSEVLSMCFLSTLSFCKRYKTNLIGLTGTIGGTASRKFLSDVYSVDFVEIPPFMYWRHIKLPHVFCANTEEWIAAVVKRVVEKLNEGRACLVITQYIHFADVLCSEIRRRVNSCARNESSDSELVPHPPVVSVGTYTGSETDIAIDAQLTPGTCIIATNIAGRGTDLKISDEVEEAGGLHVVLTSLPENDRVERQNIGRSSRTGQRGTSQMILNWDHVHHSYLERMLDRCGDGATHTVLVDTLKEVRDESNLACVERWIEELAGIEKEDSALNQFIQLRNNCVEKFKKKGKSDFHKNIRGAINFRFGIYMTTCDWALDPEKIQADFGDLADISMDNVGKCFQDYAYPVFAAWNIGDWDPDDEPETFREVQKLFGRAIELDPKFAGGAYYMRGITFLYLYKEFGDKKYIHEAIDDFQKSRDVVYRLENQYKLAMIAGKKKDEAKTKLEANMDRLLTVCGVITNSIDVLVGRNVTADLEIFKGQLEEQRKKGQNTNEMDKCVKEMEQNRHQLEKGILKDIQVNGHQIKFKMRKLEEMMPESANKKEHERELEHFYNEGYMRLVTIEDVPPIDWWDVITVSILGLLQMTLGGFLTVFSGGVAAEIGIALMLKGTFDIYTAIKDGIIDRDFNWAMFGLGKIIDVLTLGIPFTSTGLKAAAKGLVQGVKTMAKIPTKRKIAKEVLKHGPKQAVKATIDVGEKIGVFAPLNTVAAPLREAVSEVLLGEIKETTKSQLKGNENLKILVDRDNSNNNRHFTSEFVSRGYDDFVERVNCEFLDFLRKAVDKKRSCIPPVRLPNTFVKTFMAGVFVSHVKVNLKFLPDLLKNIVNCSNGTHGKEQYEYRVYEQSSTPSEDDVITDLSSRISKFCAMKAVSRAQCFSSLKFSHLIVDLPLKKTQEVMDHGSTLIHDVAYRARNAKHESWTEDKAMLEHIASIAENMDKPGERFQVKYLAEAVQSREDGKTKVIVFGKGFSKNAPIRLLFERVTGSIGHYSLNAGRKVKPSGKNTCFFDVVAHATSNHVTHLKKAAAHFMLDDLAIFRYIYFTSAYADRLILGTRIRDPPASITSTITYVEESVTVDDVLQKSNSRQTVGKYLVSTDNGIDPNTDIFFKFIDDDFEKWMLNYLKVHGIIPPNGFQVPQHDYFYYHSTIYEVCYAENGKRSNLTPTEIHAYRAKSFFAVEELDGVLPVDTNKTLNPNHTLPPTNPSPNKQLIWKNGDPTDECLRELHKKRLNSDNNELDYPGF